MWISKRCRKVRAVLTWDSGTWDKGLLGESHFTKNFLISWFGSQAIEERICFQEGGHKHPCIGRAFEVVEGLFVFTRQSVLHRVKVKQLGRDRLAGITVLEIPVDA